MNFRRGPAITGIVLTLLGWVCFTLMDTVPEYSTPQDAYMIAGYLLIGVALYFFYIAFRKPT